MSAEPRNVTGNAPVAGATTDMELSELYSREAIPYVRRSLRVSEARIDLPAVPIETTGHTLESFAESVRRSPRKAAGSTTPINALSLSSRALHPHSMSTPAVPSSSFSRARTRRGFAASKKTPSTTEPELFFVRSSRTRHRRSQETEDSNMGIPRGGEFDTTSIICSLTIHFTPVGRLRSLHQIRGGAVWANADCGGRHTAQLFKFKTGEVIKLKQPMLKVNSRKRKHRACVTEIVGTRVFALWAEDKHYYSAVVQRRVEYRSHNYIVRFDDIDTEVKLPLRACSQLRKGDTVILQTDSVVVADLSADSALMVKKAADYSAVKISPYHIEKEWAERQLAHGDIFMRCVLFFASKAEMCIINQYFDHETIATATRWAPTVQSHAETPTQPKYKNPENSGTWGFRSIMRVSNGPRDRIIDPRVEIHLD
ncbi:hypothetical protein C8R47DRAFT_1241164 [Mycena vitilis]|nr:hypothetical protein C8R47DRAFT_1241164 [Mycena vitilis]